MSMTTAADELTPATSSTATSVVEDGTCLLPSREALLEQLAERLPMAKAQPVTLFILGLPCREDGNPVTQATPAQVSSLLARSLRGNDWLGSSGPAEFAVVLSAAEIAAKTAAERLVRAVAALEVPGLWATAGVAALSPELQAGEVFRRATLCLASARRVGPGTVIRYREPLT
jgi:GGDEF domain-containing protein